MSEILAVQDLVKDYPVRSPGLWGRKTINRAVDHVSLTVAPGETLALVGQSGSGKTTMGRLVVGLERPTSGTIQVAPSGDRQPATRGSRRHELQMVFQDPYESLDSRMTVLEAVQEPLMSLPGVGSAERRDRALEMLELVEFPAAEAIARRRPYELSGGQRQRVAIARAMVANPRLVIADEPVSMLDVSIRAAVLRLFAKVQDETGVGYLFITHDLMVAQHIADRVAVMNHGQIVETGSSEQVMTNPAHEYTAALLEAAPRLTST